MLPTALWFLEKQVHAKDMQKPANLVKHLPKEIYVLGTIGGLFLLDMSLSFEKHPDKPS